MSNSSDELQVGPIFAYPNKDFAWVRTGPNSAVPSRFRVQIHLTAPEMTVEMAIMVGPGGRALIREFAVSPRDFTSTVTTRLLRKIPLDRLLRAALESVSAEPTSRPDVHPNAFQVPGDPEYQAWVSPEPATGRGREVSPDRVAQAAQIYQEAQAAGSRKPAEVVAERLNYSRATAARDIRAARKRGLLPPAGESPAGAKLSPPPTVDSPPGPVWQRVDDPDSWAPMDDILNRPMGLPVAHPGVEDASHRDPVPDAERRHETEERLRSAAAKAQEDDVSDAEGEG